MNNNIYYQTILQYTITMTIPRIIHESGQCSSQRGWLFTTSIRILGPPDLSGRSPRHGQSNVGLRFP